MMGFDSEVMGVVVCGFVFVVSFLFMWWIGIMEEARHRRLHGGTTKADVEEYKRKGEEEKRLRYMNEKKRRRLEYIRKREAKKNEENNS